MAWEAGVTVYRFRQRRQSSNAIGKKKMTTVEMRVSSTCRIGYRLCGARSVPSIFLSYRPRNAFHRMVAISRSIFIPSFR